MLKYLLVLSIFINTIYAHGISEEHIHIFGSFHMSDYILLSTGITMASYLLYRLIKKV